MKTIEISELKQMIADLVANQEKSRIEGERRTKEHEEWMKKHEEWKKKFEKTQEEWRKENEQWRKEHEEWKKKFEKTQEEWRKENEQWRKEQNKRMKKFEEGLVETRGFFEKQWSKFLESLVEGDLIPLLQKRGIDVTHTLQNIHGNPKGDNFEFDIIAVNGGEIVVVEVKTTLTNKHVKEFLAKLEKVKSVYLREYSNYKIYGAMAYLRATGGSQKQAINKKLFVIRATGNSASIVNSEDFEPRVF